MTSAVALYPALRGMIYATLLLLIGGEVALSILARNRTPIAERIALEQALIRRSRVSAGLLLLLVAVRGLLQTLTFVDRGDVVTWPLTQAAVVTSNWGHAWISQITAIVLLLATVAVRSRSAQRRPLVALTLLIIVAAQTGMGHATSSRWPADIGRILDGGHLIGAGVWLGTLGVLASAVMPQLRGDAALPGLASLISDYSVYARTGVALVVTTGVTATLVYAGSVSLLIHSSWGQLLLLKLAAMSVVVALGWYNWRIVTPALNGGNARARMMLRRAVRIELATGIVMLAITALLVASPLPGEM